MDYRKLNFKCGLEIHQQLETHKLFCNCPSILGERPDIRFKRKLRAVAGETGEIDIAALYEKEKDRIFSYEASSGATCLIEYDEAPPHNVNEDALSAVLQIALLLKAKIVDEIQVMRKTVVDGSNTSGFQRTMLIATDGFIETSKGRINIPIICLEEDAAKKIKEELHVATFNLDRLGIPLIEISTSADIKDGEHAKEVAAIIGMILRSTKRVKRGIGTIRQDVNLSIKNQARVEIKGFQDLRTMPKVIENEVKRQLSMIEKDEKLKPEVRAANSDGTTTFMRPIPGAARMYPESDLETIPIKKNLLARIKVPELITEKAIKLEKKYKLNPDLAKEIIKEEIDLEKFTKRFGNIAPSVIANILVEIPKEIKKRYNLDIKKIKEKDFEDVLAYLNKGDITKEAVIEILADAARGRKISISGYKKVSEKSLEREIRKIIDKNKGASINALMGEVMKEYKGKVDGKMVMGILKRLV